MLPLLSTPGLTPLTPDPESDPGSPSSERWIASSSEVAPSGWELGQRKTVTVRTSAEVEKHVLMQQTQRRFIKPLWTFAANVWSHALIAKLS